MPSIVRALSSICRLSAKAILVLQNKNTNKKLKKSNSQLQENRRIPIGFTNKNPNQKLKQTRTPIKKFEANKNPYKKIEAFYLHSTILWFRPPPWSHVVKKYMHAVKGVAY